MQNVFSSALMITAFIFMMMVMIEYLNVLTSGSWQRKLAANKWGQYLFAGLLGVMPGCLGVFVVVSMYSHRIITLGAVVAAMVATSGDESYVMLAMIPERALLIMLALFIIGVLAGMLTDILYNRRNEPEAESCELMEIHKIETCRCFPGGQILQQWKECSPFRATLAIGLLVFSIVIATGQVGPATWNWIRITLLIASSLSVFIVFTVPNHFLEEHLWQHAAKEHVPRVFLWTFGTLTAIYLVTGYLQLEDVIRDRKWILLLFASLVGLIPESGPHLVFVTLYAQGAIPISILLANSIVQDGHGMLPMLAHSRKSFLLVKGINFLIGITFGIIALVLGL